MEFYYLRTIISRVRRLKIPLFVALFFTTLTSKHGISQQTDDDAQHLRELFLKSRQQLEIVPSPSPSPRPTPTPAASPLRHPYRSPSPEPAARRQNQSTPSATASETDNEEEESTPAT
ncbi:MAG TPA: hypothetical protein VE154_00700, partial [Chthoniobacterales bacterium]|nr:hypothetical protein [Chthoniobacterales bacterium]